MLSGDGTVKILDFGLATLAKEAIQVEDWVEPLRVRKRRPKNFAVVVRPRATLRQELMAKGITP